MSSKLTTPIVRKTLASIHPSISLVGEYRGNNLPLKCVCRVCSHRWRPVWINLRRKSYKCPRCSGKSLPITEVRKWAKKFNVMVLNSPRSMTDPLECECSVCGYAWEKLWSRKKLRKRGCPECSKKNRLSVHDIEKGVKSVEARGIKILDKYKNSHAPLRCQCLVCGNRWEAQWGNLVRLRTGCRACRDRSKVLTTQEVKLALRGINPSIEIVGEYKSSTKPLNVQCRECKTEWRVTWHDLRRGYGCPTCKRKFGHTEQKVRRLIESITGWKFPPDRLKVRGKRSLGLDGYNERHNTAFEYQGEHHYIPIHGIGSLRSHKRNDERKRSLCRLRGVKLIRVPYWKRDIKSFLLKKLEAFGVT